MAVVTLGVDTPDASNTDSYVSGAFTPAAGDLLVVVASNSASVATPTCASSVGGKTFTRAHVLQQAATHSIALFVSDQGSSATSQTVTVEWVGDPATGSVITVLLVSGMSLYGAAAVVQVAGEEVMIGDTPEINFGSAPDAANVIILGIRGNQTALSATPPTNFTEHSDSGYTPPIGGLETCSRASGQTDTQILWGAAPGVVTTSIGVELDTAAAGVSTSAMAGVAQGMGHI